MKIKSSVKSIILISAVVITSVFFISSSDKDFEILKNLDIFVSMFNEIDQYYVDEKDPESLINSSIQGMLESLDPYTTYIPESEMEEFRFMTTGQYGGIGALIRKAGNYTMISEPYEDFPAQRAGLRAGDTILSIDGISTLNKDISQVSELLKGNPNTELIIKLKRIGDTAVIEKTFNREQITIKNVPYYDIVDDNIGYLRLSNFTKNASKEVRTAFTKLKEMGAKSIIVDLRGNPGGLLNESVDIANIWINKDQEIVSTHGKAKQWDNVYKTTKPAIDTSIPLAVLVNRGSASASEIVAGSLQDLDRAIIVGQRTFGKGLVQTTRPLSYNTHLKITTAKYYIPSGRCIQALDYTHRNEDGSVGYIPDSLISEFKTKNGRTVKDGGGIMPDILVDLPDPGNITVNLYGRNYIFDFATYYAAEHSQIVSPEEFEITDELYTEFVDFVKSKEFDYSAQSNEKLDELILIAKREGYYKIAKEEIESLRGKFIADKEKDLITFQDEIKELLVEEIVSRYYYQSGRIAATIKNDPQLKKAVEILKEPDAVTSILHGIYDKGEIKLALESIEKVN